MSDTGFVPLDVFLRNHEASRQQLAIKLLYEVSQELSAVHSSGRVHGGLRCENILVAPDLKTVKLVGLEHSFDWNALRFRMLGHESSAEDLGISVSSAVRWLAPETIAGGVPTPASDMYAFGLAVYEALAGAVPFEDKDEATVVALKKTKDTPQLNRHADKIDREAWALIQDTTHANAIFRPSAQITAMTLRSLQSKASSYTATHSHVVSLHSVGMTLSSLPRQAPAMQAVASTSYVPVVQAAGTTYQFTPAPTTYQYARGLPVAGANVSLPSVNKAPPMPAIADAPRQAWRKYALLALGVVVIVAVAVGAATKSSTSRTRTTSDPGSPPQIQPLPSLSPAPSPVASPSSATESPTLTPWPTSSMPVVLPSRTPPSGSDVETLLDGVGQWSLTAVAAAADGTIYGSDGAVIFSFREDSTDEPVLVAGSGTRGYVNGPALQAQFAAIYDLAIDAQGNILVADLGCARVRKVRLDRSPITVEDIAGNGERESVDGALLSASFKTLTRIATSSVSGNMYAPSYSTDTVRKIDLNRGQVSTLPVHIYMPQAVAVSPRTDELFVSSDCRVLQFSADGTNVYETAGNWVQGFNDGIGTEATFMSISALAFSSTGDFMYIADSGGNCIRRLDMTSKAVTTLAGLCDQSPSESVDGDSRSARFAMPMSLAVTPGGSLLVVDLAGTKSRVRRIKLSP